MGWRRRLKKGRIYIREGEPYLLQKSGSFGGEMDEAEEVLARREARRSFGAFMKYMSQGYEEAWFHTKIIEALERVERGECRRLMVCMPPRHGKSELCSRHFPAWYLGRNPKKEIIAASYNSDLATDFGREVRNIVASPEYGHLFPFTKLAEDAQAANRWNTREGGKYVAAGVGTSITGRGADILLVDDAFKDRKEADSELRREDVWAWYTSTAYTRLMPGACVIIITTRWHEDDLAGRLLAEQETGDRWELLSFPATNENGEALWPDRYPIEVLDRIESVLPVREWNCLYQQDPIPDTGDYFKTEWFTEYTILPDDLSYYGASDYAVTSDGDFTEHGVIGVDFNGNIYVADWWYGKTAPDEWIEAMCDLIHLHKPMIWFGEGGVIRRSVEPFMITRMVQRNAFCRIEWLSSISDKSTRARSIQAMASMGKVFVPAKAKWLDRWLSQMMKFPAGKNDDIVDVMSLFGRGIEQFSTPVRSVKIPKNVVPLRGWMAM